VEKIMEFRLRTYGLMNEATGWPGVLCVCMLNDEMLCGGVFVLVLDRPDFP